MLISKQLTAYDSSATFHDVPRRIRIAGRINSRPETKDKGEFDRAIWCVAGIPVDACDMAGAVATVALAATDQRQCVVSTPIARQVWFWRICAGTLDPGLRRDDEISGDDDLSRDDVM